MATPNPVKDWPEDDIIDSRVNFSVPVLRTLLISGVSSQTRTIATSTPRFDSGGVAVGTGVGVAVGAGVRVGLLALDRRLFRLFFRLFRPARRVGRTVAVGRGVNIPGNANHSPFWADPFVQTPTFGAMYPTLQIKPSQHRTNKVHVPPSLMQ
jgi:hypothetical protein